MDRAYAWKASYPISYIFQNRLYKRTYKVHLMEDDQG